MSLALVAVSLMAAIPTPAQVGLDEGLEAVHEERLFNRAERAVHGALLASSDRIRDEHLETAVQVARHLVARDSASADAHYWLAVALGLKTEYGGPLEKLTTGKEVFFTTARVLELDPGHAGGHEMMGRLHAAVMRLPWLVRKMALGMGMGDALGEASWTRAEDHLRRACELDPAAAAPRLELAKLHLSWERPEDARRLLDELAALTPADEVDRRIVAEGRALLASVSAFDGHD